MYLQVLCLSSKKKLGLFPTNISVDQEIGRADSDLIKIKQIKSRIKILKFSSISQKKEENRKRGKKTNPP